MSEAPGPGRRALPDGEVPALRSERSLTFARDGFLEARFFDVPVNYQDAAGVWQRIDNRLITDERTGGWRNAGNSYDLQLPADVGTAPVRFAVGSGRDAAWVGAQLTGASGPGEVSAEAVTYRQALPGVDAVHEATDGAAKESLLLAGAHAGSEFGYQVSVSPGVIAQVRERAVVFTRRGTEVFRFLPPFAVDAAGVRTDAASYTLTPADGGYELRVSLDASWLSAPERAWPVLLDPTTSRPPTAQNTITGGTLTDTSSADRLCVGQDEAAGGAQRALVSFQDVRSQVPSTAQVIHAEVGLYRNGTGSGTIDIQPRALARSWGADATWNAATAGQPWTTPGGQVTGPSGTTATVSAGTGYHIFHVTDIVTGWVRGDLAQHGLLMRRPVEGAGGSVCFRTGSHPEPNTGPFLQVRYVDRIGELPAHTYREFQLNDRTVAKVNLYDGNLMLSSRDLTLPGVGIDLDLSHTYNSLDYGTINGAALPTRWRLSLTGEVALRNFQDGVVFIGPDGATWRFPLVNGGYQSPPGLNATLTKETDGTWKIVYHKTQVTYRFSLDMLLDLIQDRNGNILRLNYPAGSSAPTSITDTRGRTSTISYAGDRITKVTDPIGREHTYLYSPDSQRLTGYRNPDGKTTSYDYDSNNRLIRLTTPEGRITTFTYFFNYLQKITQVTNTTDLTGPTTGFTYNRNSNQVPTTTVVAEPAGGNTTYEFEPFSYRVTKSTDPLGRSRSATYTPNDDIATAVDAMGSGSTPGNTTTYGYDSRNNPISRTLPTGAIGSNEYADTAHPYQPSSSRSEDGNSTSYGYDSRGNLRTSTDTTNSPTGGAQLSYTHNPPADQSATCGGLPGQVCTATDGDGNTTRYRYDDTGQLTLTTPPAPLGATSNAFDGVSRTTAVTDGKGQTTGYLYDQLDRLLEQRYAGATTCTSSDISNGRCIRYTYDGDGNRTSMQDQTGTSTYTYDSLNREKTRTLPSTGTTSLTYDAAGNILTATDASGTITYRYDLANQLISLAEPGTNCPTDGSTTTGCTRFGYNSNGVRTKITYPTSPVTVVDLKPDDSSRPQTIDAVTPSTTDADLRLSYTYERPVDDAATDGALVRTRTDRAAGLTTTYGYDSLARLNSAVERNSAGSTTARWLYCYDNAGNRIFDSTTSTSCGQNTYYNEANQIKSRNGSTAFSYDSNGAETSAVGSTTRTAGSWNAKQQHTAATVGTAVTNYGYTGDGNKLRLTAGMHSFRNTALGVTARTVGGTTTSFVREPDGTLVAMRVGGASYYYLLDNLGSVLGLVNSSGHRTHTYSYDPYGVPRTTIQPSAADNPYRFTGGHRDAQTGLYKLGIRYYDPTLGRFTQPDPTGQDPHYTYAGNNPVNASDPSGAISVSVGFTGVTFDLNAQESDDLVDAVTAGTVLSAFIPGVGPFVAAVGALDVILLQRARRAGNCFDLRVDIGKAIAGSGAVSLSNIEPC